MALGDEEKRCYLGINWTREGGAPSGLTDGGRNLGRTHPNWSNGSKQQQEICTFRVTRFCQVSFNDAGRPLKAGNKIYFIFFCRIWSQLFISLSYQSTSFCRVTSLFFCVCHPIVNEVAISSGGTYMEPKSIIPKQIAAHFACRYFSFCSST